MPNEDHYENIDKEHGQMETRNYFEGALVDWVYQKNQGLGAIGLH